MERILILIAGDTFSDVRRALTEALENAASRERVSCGICLQEEPGPEDSEHMQALGTLRFVCPGDDVWSRAEELWQGEQYILTAHPAMIFSRHWDLALLRALRQCPQPGRSVLTGILPDPEDKVDAVSPVAAVGFDAAGGLCYGKGTPLRYARKPLMSAFLNPAFCFGPAAFFLELGRRDCPELPAFLAATRLRWNAYTLHRSALRMGWNCELPPSMIPAGGWEELLERFDSRYFLHLGRRELTPQGRTGIFTADLTFPVRVPGAVRLQERARDAVNRRSQASPLLVTCHLSGMETGECPTMTELLQRFRYLAGIRNIPLFAYADGETARLLMPVLPNILEYKARYGLPVEQKDPGRLNRTLMALSKPFLLVNAREKFLNHTHYAWIDFDYLRYPVYGKASPDWEVLCSDRIVLATVSGQPDLSMMVVPDRLLNGLCAEVLARCEACLSGGFALPTEDALWTRLIHDRPEWFSLVELPTRRDLLEQAMLGRNEEFHTV